MVEAIDQTLALRLQLTAIVGGEPDSSRVEVRPLYPDGRPALAARAFVPVGQALDRVPDRVDALAGAMNVFIGACPRVREDGTAAAVERCWTLWCDLDTPDALARLAGFRPLPSIVVRTGSGGGHAYWPLHDSIPPAWARLGNRRLARHLGGDPRATDAARVLRPCGSLNHKHRPPRPVVCTRLELDVFEAADVVRGLPDEPPAQTVSPVPRGDRGALLAGLVRSVERAQVGNRNCALHWAACRAVEHAAAGDLDPGEAHNALHAAALNVGLGEPEIEATLRSASSTVGVAA